jgi:hypothetical protein
LSVGSRLICPMTQLDIMWDGLGHPQWMKNGEIMGMADKRPSHRMDGSIEASWYNQSLEGGSLEGSSFRNGINT